MALAAVVAALPTYAQASDDDAAELEAALAADQAESAATRSSDAGGSSAGQSMNPDLALIMDVAGAWFSDEDHLQTGGHDPDHNGFNLQQLELNATSIVDPYFRFDGNLVFSLYGVEVEEAYATTLDLPGTLQVRFGQMLTRFGRINATHPHTWNFVDQAFAIGRVFGGEGSRGLGVELSWLTPLPWFVELVGSATHAAGDSTARSFYGSDDPGVEDAGGFLYTTALEQFFPLHDDWSLSWGLSTALGPNSTGRGNRTDVYGTDVYLKYRPISRQSYTVVSLQTEVLYRRRQVPADLLQDASGYAEIFWRYAQRWGVAGRYEFGSPERGLDGNVPSDPRFMLDPEWTRNRHRLTANVTFWPTEFSRLRLQGSEDFLSWRDEVVSAVFLAAEVATGAHGAHAF